ncbi:uncharacterized protein UTRI_05281_B [Ustilago trichophora]|uniref:Queuosine 5'-phosphate N-glycosylase/hydrolase n=1 Tax=Ustilago trichophora TaxID=86804 RepID=A0A5C3EMX6_9BASI|nr:uncharacterized protein UTRI_05281_B [Ustilago trichophora]
MSTSTTTNPLPPTDEYIKATRESCLSLSTTLGLTPNLSSIDSFLRNLDQATFEKLKTQHGLTFPLRFPTPTAEINFLSILALLNAFSGYRTAFHKATGIGAYQNVLRLMIGLYISGSDGGEDRMVGSSALTAKGMAGLTEAKVVELLGVSIHQEKEHDKLPGVTVGVRGGEMFDCVQLMLSTINNVGKALMGKNLSSLGAYMVQLLEESKAKQLDDEAATDYLARQIAETFPEFRDTHTLSSGQGDVYLFKRIFFLLHSLHLRFGDRAEFGVPNTFETLPMFVDNVLPTLCVWYNFLSVPASRERGMETLFDWVKSAHCNADLPRSKLDSLEENVAGPRLSPDETYAVRAATLNLGRVVVERAKQLAKEEATLAWLKDLNEVDLDGYLWAVAKHDVGLRKVPRLVFPSIHF